VLAVVILLRAALCDKGVKTHNMRRAGVLLHPTSLPGGGMCGELGNEAYDFVDFLVASDMRVWQMLPVGPTHDDLSPYQCYSAFAGNVSLISLEKVLQEEWLQIGEYHLFLEAVPDKSTLDKLISIKFLYGQFCQNATDAQKEEFSHFESAHKHWLDDFSLFSVLKNKFISYSWVHWPKPLRDRKQSALQDARLEYSAELKIMSFAQFLFFKQWDDLKQYANQRGIELFGDLPLFVAHDSADVWARRELFKLDGEGQPTFVAGVPPDYFSETGQRWGNPVYDWVAMQVDGYQWWLERFDVLFKQFDLVRIDHFRGLEAYWEIPASHETALNGSWVDGPKDDFFNALKQKYGAELPLVAEDLGVITEDVDRLRKENHLPGMKILHFAFDSDSLNPYLPHNHEIESVVYTGTHDNNTTLGWYNSLDDQVKTRISEYFAYPQEAMPWLLIRSAFSSVAELAIIPMQDLLSLGGEHRMNTPGTTEGNWHWRFSWEQVNREELTLRVQKLAQLYRR